MKKIGFNAFITATALAVGICSFASMPGGRALSERERIVSRGLHTQCEGCYQTAGCTAAQPIPTKPGKKYGDEVLICKGTPTKSRYSAWSQTQELDYVSMVQTCKGTVYRWKQNDQGQLVWVRGKEEARPECGTFTECNDREGGWSMEDGIVVDTREDYREQCDKSKPTE